MPDINWRPAAEWAAASARWRKSKRFYTAIVLVETRSLRGRLGGWDLEEVYELGGRLVLNRPMVTFSAPAADEAPKEWRRFAVVKVQLKPRPKESTSG